MDCRRCLEDAGPLSVILPLKWLWTAESNERLPRVQMWWSNFKPGSEPRYRVLEFSEDDTSGKVLVDWISIIEDSNSRQTSSFPPRLIMRMLLVLLESSTLYSQFNAFFIDWSQIAVLVLSQPKYLKLPYKIYYSSKKIQASSENHS